MLKIGVIDSGLGGLSILKSCLDTPIIAEYWYIYDNKFHPYGGRSKEELAAITFLNIDKLMGIGCDIIVLACNTATSACIDDMRRTFFLPIIGTEPPIKKACEECSTIALLATPYTLHSERVKKIIDAHGDVKFYFPDCSGIATAVEYGFASDSYLIEKLTPMLLRHSDCEGIVIGCTHYSFAKSAISSIAPNSKIYEPCQGVANQLKSKVGNYIASSGASSVRIITTEEELNSGKINFITTYLAPYKISYR